ncbi:hypothetical protein ACU686_03815 [Yinghuangia aomiensis]
MDKREDIQTALLLLVVGAAVSELAARGRRHRVVALTDDAYLATVHTTAELAATGQHPELVADHVSAQLTGLLDLKRCR